MMDMASSLGLESFPIWEQDHWINSKWIIYKWQQESVYVKQLIKLVNHRFRVPGTVEDFLGDDGGEVED